MPKARSAFEYLITYGWVLLVILVMIGALSYFGVLDPGRFLPPYCHFESGVTCIDYIIQAGPFYFFEDKQGDETIRLQLRNDVGRAIVFQDFAATISGSDGCPTSETMIGKFGAIDNDFVFLKTAKDNFTIAPQEIFEIAIACHSTNPHFSKGERIRINITMHYRQSGSSFIQSVRGTVVDLAR